MVLEYVRDSIPNARTPNLEVEDIAKVVNTDVDGTVLEDVNTLNSNKEFLKAIPSLRFETSYLSSFSEIDNEINANRPVIAWILISQDHREFVHSVVVTGVDIENNSIYYNDPASGEIQDEIGSFNSKWEKVDNVLIKTRIGERKQRKMDEYDKNESGEEIQ